jgi:benzoyl-CoA 2,3-dioxygenase component B
MLTEEAHHLFVGETGVGRVLRRTVQLMRDNQSEDVRPFGGIPFDIVQKYINYWFSTSLDLFGSEDSTNAANYFANGLKGRFDESNRKTYPDATGREGAYAYELYDPEVNSIAMNQIPMRRAMNAILRDSYVKDCVKVCARWNKALEKEGSSLRVKLPSDRFHRSMGSFAQAKFDPDGNILTEEQWNKRISEFIPTKEDKDYVKSTMTLVTEPGKFANWIAPPSRGIHGKPIEFEYVRL